MCRAGGPFPAAMIRFKFADRIRRQCMANNYRVAVIAGDGIGREVMPEGIAAMEAAARIYGFGFQWHEFDWSCGRYVKSGTMMPEDGIERLRLYDGIYL